MFIVSKQDTNIFDTTGMRIFKKSNNSKYAICMCQEPVAPNGYHSEYTLGTYESKEERDDAWEDLIFKMHHGVALYQM